jgi:diguanylate cyclase (GGDEF)-like protein/PAS domain S-box-containing protein
VDQAAARQLNRLVASDGLLTVLDNLPDAVAVIDGEGTLKWGNSSTERLFGWPIENWIGASGLDLIHPEDLEMALLSLASVQGKEVGSPIEVRVRTDDGWRLVELVGAPLPEPLEGCIAISLRDLTQRRRWEVASGDENRFRTLVHNAATVILLVLPSGEVQSVSASLTRMLGHDTEVVEGRPIVELVDDDDRNLLSSALARAMANPPRANQPPVTVEVRLRQRGRSATVPFELTIVNLVDDPTVGGFVISGHDISRLRAAQEELETLARIDSLTGLANRASLDRHLGDRLAAGRSFVVAFMDLDRFKPVNDLLGHDAGDELLRQLAQRLQSAVRGRDFVARFGGDEFVVVADADAEGTRRLAERIESLVAEPFLLESGPAQVFASVGVAAATVGHTAESLLAEADAEMYAVKRARRGNPWSSTMAVSERRRLSEQLAEALVSDQMELHFQPIWRLRGLDLWGWEALVRWQHPERGLLPPAAFLDVVEDSGRENELGELVLRRSVAFAAAAGGSGIIAVNVSASQMAADGFPDLVDAVLADFQFPADRLCLEISERSLLDRPAQGASTPISHNLDLLAARGVALAIDDFGTGYSSMTHVVQFPVSILKIDQSFVARVVEDRQGRSVVAALVELSRGLGIESVAEGVERGEQLEALSAMGCGLGQGYLLGRPVPAHELPRTTTLRRH